MTRPIELEPLETSRAAHGMALGFALCFPLAATYGYFIVLSGAESMALAYTASKVLQFGFPLAWVLTVQRRPIRWQRPELAALAWGAAFGVAVVVVTLTAYFGYFKHSAFLERTPELVAAKLRDMGLTTPAKYFSFALFLSVPHALLEEYYWRWFVFGQMRRVTPLPWAIAISSLGFMAHHVIVVHQFLQGAWAITLLFSLCVAAGGAVWAWLYHRFRSLYGPWIGHFLVDCVIMYIGYDLAIWSA
jgi:membrane protease YdiL (CAAX protease family)